VNMPEFLSKHGFNTTRVRSDTMKRIKSKNTKPELILRQYLWRKGVRYRLLNNDIIGKPDLTIRKSKIAIFIDGEFWHGYNWAAKRQKIVSNREYWISKIEKNIERDNKVNHILTQSGWVVIRFWGEEISSNIESCLKAIIPYLNK